MGSVYEQLAAAASPEAEPGTDDAEPAPKPSRKRRPAKEDAIKRDMDEMDDMGKQMQREVERRRGQ